MFEIEEDIPDFVKVRVDSSAVAVDSSCGFKIKKEYENNEDDTDELELVESSYVNFKYKEENNVDELENIENISQSSDFDEKLDISDINLQSNGNKFILGKELPWTSNAGLKCHFCNKRFLSKSTFDQHSLETHKEQIIKNLDTITSQNDACKICTCPFCHELFGVKSELYEHILKQHKSKDEEYPPIEMCCDTFNVDTDSQNVEEDTKIDISDITLQSNEYSDNDNIFESSSAGETHRTLATKPTSNHHLTNTKFKCHFCNEIFSNKLTFDNHSVETHKNKIIKNLDNLITSRCKVCTCPFCHDLLSLHFSLSKHLLKEHTELVKSAKGIILIKEIQKIEEANRISLNKHCRDKMRSKKK